MHESFNCEDNDGVADVDCCVDDVSLEVLVD